MICSQNFKGSNNEEIEFIILSKTRFDQLELHQRTDHKDTKQDYEDVEGFDSLRKTWKLWFGIIDWPLGSTLYIFNESDHVSRRISNVTLNKIASKYTEGETTLIETITHVLSVWDYKLEQQLFPVVAEKKITMKTF